MTLEEAARALVDRWRWDLANQPEIRALAEALDAENPSHAFPTCKSGPNSPPNETE